MTHHNFRRLASSPRESLRLRLPRRAGVASGVEEAKSGVVGTSALEFTQPDLVWRIDLNTRLEYERGLEPAYDFDAVKSRVGFPVHLTRDLTFTPGYNLELYDVRGDAQGSGRAELSAECNSRRGRASGAPGLRAEGASGALCSSARRPDPRTFYYRWSRRSSSRLAASSSDRVVLEQTCPAAGWCRAAARGGVFSRRPTSSRRSWSGFSGAGALQDDVAPHAALPTACSRPAQGQAPGVRDHGGAVRCAEKALTTSLRPSVTVPSAATRCSRRRSCAC
jgi:hypothetical protein